MFRDHGRRIKALDGMRGLAAMLVLFSHAEHYGYLTIPGGAGMGKIGVMIFFVLSGFLIGTLYSSKEFCLQEIQAYLAARLARVLPLYAVTLCGGVGLLLIFGHSGYAFDDLSGFLQNALLLKGTGVLWSIPVEIHFYLLFILLWAGRKTQWGPLVIVGLLIIQVTLVVLLKDRVQDHNYLVFWLHLFLLGYAISQIWMTKTLLGETDTPIRAGRLLSYGAFIVSLGLMPWLREYIGFTQPPIFLDPFVILAITISFFFALIGQGPYIFLKHPVVCRLGDWSFGIYLIHPPVIFLLNELELKERLGQFPALVVLVAMTIGTAALAWVLIEAPMGRRLRSYLSRRPQSRHHAL